MRLSLSLPALLASLSLAACGGGDDDDTSGTDGGGGATDADLPRADAFVSDCSPVSGSAIVLQPFVSGFAAPLFLTSPPGDPRMFVIEQAGTIRIIDDGAVVETPFLDITSSIDSGGEQGLLGLAFHPDYATNRRFFVYYTAAGTGANTVAEYVASARDANLADENSGTPLLEIDDFAPNHNGGMIAFGDDGYLYVGTGDGGGGGDPDDNGQDVTALLAKMLRIDVDGGDPYGVPGDNPLVGSATPGVRGEIWHIGLRNPWRWSFDRQTHDQWIGDVGQGGWEEIDHVPAGIGGLNFGWSDKEADECENVDPCVAPAGDEPTDAFTDPIAQYVNPPGDNYRAVVGGFVYRGSCFPDLQGTYFYGDSVTSEIWTIDADQAPLPAPVALAHDAISAIYSFGEDAAGEVYLLTADGAIYRIGVN